jgi:hypothetical protein
MSTKEDEQNQTEYRNNWAKDLNPDTWGKVENPFEINLFPSNLYHSNYNDILWKKNNLNNYNYRCEDFKDNHDGFHILFSGCSTTFGEGLLIEEIWSKKLYNKISSKNKASGYFNLALAGVSTLEIIINIFRYIKKFGNPNFIFLNLPNDTRFYSYDSKSKNFTYSNLEPNTGNMQLYYTAPLISFQYLMMLEAYCNSNKIKLNVFSWDVGAGYGKENIESFTEIKNNDLAKLIFEYKENNKNDTNATYARDGMHHGTAIHHAWSEIMYNKYIEDMGV